MAPSTHKGKVVANGRSTELAKAAPATEDAADVVKVNNASLTELKNALDDAAKAFFNRDDGFRQVHTHEDVRIVLGWFSCLVAGGVSLYGWKAGWAATKGWTYFAVSTYVVVSAVLWAYAKFIEKDIVYVGTRRVVSKRVVTERLTLTSTVPSFTPEYHLTLRYTSSANSGKSLIRDHRGASTPSFGRFFDSEGTLDLDAWEGFLAGLMSKARGD